MYWKQGAYVGFSKGFHALQRLTDGTLDAADELLDFFLVLLLCAVIVQIAELVGPIDLHVIARVRLVGVDVQDRLEERVA